MSNSFDKLAEIVKFNNLGVVENELEDFNSLELYFYKFNDSKDPIKDYELAGRMNYDIVSNDLEIDWEGKAPELIVMAVDSYIQESYLKSPEKYLINSFGLYESFKLRKD